MRMMPSEPEEICPMRAKHQQSESMARLFRRDYLIVSTIPLLTLLLLVILGITITRGYLTDLIKKSTYELNSDAELSLQNLGEKIIQTKARDVAKQIEIYFRMNPHLSIQEMRTDPLFQKISLQVVGENGYTAVYEAPSCIFRVHPNAKLLDRDASFLRTELPSWWTIVEPTLSGGEVSGYYNWIEPDGDTRRKYMTVTPVKQPLHGTTMMVAATTYIDEFSAPLFDMKYKASRIVHQYQAYMLQQLFIFGLIACAVILMTAAGTYFLGRRAAFHYIHPIIQLAATAREFGEGNWDADAHEQVRRRTDEIGILAQAFSRMSLQLKELFRRLEGRVAELKQTQAALKESEGLYRSLFNGVPVGLYRSSVDGRILGANPNLIEMLGYAGVEDFKEINTADLYTHPDDRVQWQAQIAQNNGTFTFEKRMRKRDGTEIWVEDHARAVRDEHGQVLYYEGSLKDTTHRKVAEAALKQSEERFKTLYEESKRAEEVYRSLIHSSADAIVIYDLGGCVKYLSPMFTKIFGWSAEDLLGKPIPFLPQSERDASLAIIDDLTVNGTPCHGFETKRTTKDGRLIDVSISASRYDDHEGRPAGMLLILRDISEKKRLEAQLQQIERMEAIGTLAGGIAHDFNNLLMTIQGSISLIRLGMAPSHPHYKDFLNIEKQVQRASRLTGQLLGYARKGKYEVKAILINDIVMESTETFNRTRKDIIVHYDLAPDIAAVEADVGQIDQVLMNLFINASDAMPEGGNLYLTTRNIPAAEMAHGAYAPKPGDYVMLKVEDTGAGMDAKTMERIFDPFFTTKEMGRGTGLGLASVYGIVKGHGGYIDVDSQPGKGTAFCIYLPATKGAIEVMSAEPAHAAAGKGTILFIDDEMLVLEVVSKMMGILGYTVMTADSGLKAVEIFKEHKDRIDLIVLDMIMPDMSGSQAFDRLREIKPEVKVILSSGYSIDGKATEILKRGCNGFIQKPYSMEQLGEKIQQVMSGPAILAE
ncbi:MAG: PAS domain S-box protein [Desulfobacteraceae bacterium]|nr:MAG: PAS domain S-box protein [Desulfobacteraceae bacterium]